MSLKLQDIFDVKGKVVLVTGGGTGLGKAISSGFVQNGAKVYITARRQQVLEEAAKEIGGDIIPIQGDVSTKEGCKAIADALSAKESKLDALINCAGVMRAYKTTIKDHNNPDEVEKLLWEGHDDDDFNYSNAININGPYFMTCALIPLLRKSDLRSVVIIASIAGLANQRATGSVSYGVSKAAAIHLGKLLAGRLHPLKIRVNTICPGIFPSEMTGKNDAGQGLEYDIGEIPTKAAKRSTVGRPGLPEEIVGPVLLLSSKAGGYFDGAMLTVDGGRLMVSGPFCLVSSPSFLPVDNAILFDIDDGG
ncbi:hypothetical protein C347_06725 [Cryptococcus neoformans AD2-60a]|uniref:Uncharacterized protein n=1 Tax=Cryptococcus neoformans Tu259-1 TaxID=1230072 RepID=A0A854Q8I0_CRYNE|nr:hypothetical protein C347_06725 [Cryptococcus neoformans var. grubii AD2-60a]OWZ26722.1 hypothetical protein C353_06764 [Cryptococcus neoformans var. grubii AD1-83a]OWZ50067.1 hypothetical protein C368_06770 [Cryptococcus neoformans var. grubii 125.91]OWZ75027.1 hypothetical protein C365_06699 [Cryptococcus neoformans var. grubii Bt85]OXC81149.1 hypothetical protein C344_06632 [Cryptococcus neoformans var. grubii AD1-7a]OXG14440.1 hypothetical protein C361_05742 [Cryptococcus neoformans var